MPLPLFPLVVGTLLLNVADGVPAFNVAPTCSDVIADDASTGRTAQDCLREENAARDSLRQQWTQYPLGDRTTCTAATIAGIPSYVELLTCLEMARETRSLPKEDGLNAQGSATKP